MNAIHPRSLADTLDAVEERFFRGQAMTAAERGAVARWIADRQGLTGSYAGMFAPADGDWRGITVFTGETITTRAGISHVLGEEACRALIRLGASRGVARTALDRATRGMLNRLQPRGGRSSSVDGMYCCGVCSVALWRHLAVGGLSQSERRLVAGMKTLRAHRIGGGRWRRFPLWYTLLALSEIDVAGARAEMQYAAPVCERYVRQGGRKGEYSRRRRLVAERILEKC
ncbi:MAG TPA: hypothetical protein VMV72_17875 [Verrucomicrobiae bacterium]|nr:hypothetical protein [Verrucomicrobiae bacterium]